MVVRREVPGNRRVWWGALKRTVRQVEADNLFDWAAALTYYSVLSIFPGLLLLVALLRLTGMGTLTAAVDNLTLGAPPAVSDLVHSAVHGLASGGTGTAGLFLGVSLAASLWSASGYLGAFMRAANVIYDVPEGRPIWKTLPIRLGLTVVTGVLVLLVVLLVVLTGRLAGWVGQALGIGSATVTGWEIVKWPVLVLLVSLLFAVLYWAAPNARRGRLRLLSPGGLVAVAIWLAASAGFAAYVANFGSYNKTYGSLAAVIIFLVWLWISNLAILVGAEFDAELDRGRAIQAGHPPDQEPYLELRDTRSLSRRDRARLAARSSVPARAGLAGGAALAGGTAGGAALGGGTAGGADRPLGQAGSAP